MLASQPEPAPLAAVRRRTQSFLAYLFWVFATLALLWGATLCAQLARQSVVLLRGIRSAFGFAAPISGPDLLLLGTCAALALLGLFAVLTAYLAYRSAWNTRLENARLNGRLPTRRNQEAYLNHLAASPAWQGTSLPSVESGPRAIAEAMLRHLESDIAARAITTGLVVGVNRNPLLDTVTICAAALELQLHVLTQLGQRPSLGTWVQLLQRSAASVFLNTYVTREDALTLNLLIRKAALGLEFAAETTSEAAGALADVDWDELLHGVSLPGLSAVTSFATMSMSVGAFGLRHIGLFIEAASSELLQGVLAGGVLYFHGMSLAADLLAVDRGHRASPAMTRTIAESMSAVALPAGRILRNQVRAMRGFLRERRQLAFTAAKDAARQGVDRVRDTSRSQWSKVRGTGKPA